MKPIRGLADELCHLFESGQRVQVIQRLLVMKPQEIAFVSIYMVREMADTDGYELLRLIEERIN